MISSSQRFFISQGSQKKGNGHQTCLWSPKEPRIGDFVRWPEFKIFWPLFDTFPANCRFLSPTARLKSATGQQCSQNRKKEILCSKQKVLTFRRKLFPTLWARHNPRTMKNTESRLFCSKTVENRLQKLQSWITFPQQELCSTPNRSLLSFLAWVQDNDH